MAIRSSAMVLPVSFFVPNFTASIQTIGKLLQSSLPGERELLQQIARGDESAYTLVFNHYSKQVFSAAMLYLKDTIPAREVVQEVFLKIWLKREAMSDVEDLTGYLFILTRNHIYDSFKKQATLQKVLDNFVMLQPATIADADYRLEERQYDHLLNKAVSALPPERKKVYIARKEGMTNEEISHRMNISIHTVKKQMQLAVQTVRSFVKQQLHI
ncbi:RNA polymerase sigma factor [Chitinophaga rhizophila]|uniref:Sigma-70 family RNA polymerase sigma factor n=1 Tax=Chitinophaga rhizophila TaxID=2866212 RepID=A0ABS7GCV3_9BACT|nr:sigma-70 family RNA polymerase sigma factor [Chitinophaga rhizophila]MBW8685251.1 sigma-70 family RNA polymerase sigma factor [Chitinophaga rhizophila]